MIDFHCHLDLYKDPVALLPEVRRRCKYVLAVTTSPRAWQKTRQVFAGFDCIKVALGLHPEILSNKMNEIDILLSYIGSCKYIGEVGIDGSSQYTSSFQTQKELFEKIIQTTEKCGGKIVSIHSRNAATPVLDTIENNIAKSVPVLHWFSGSTKELERANELGCWFSVSPAMLSSQKGRNLVSMMPLSRILPETDAPFTQKNNRPYMPWEAMSIADTLEEIFNLNSQSVRDGLMSNTRRLLDIQDDIV